MLFRKSFIILLLLPLYSFPQNNYVFQHLTVEDGLLSNPRVNIFQDAEGFYWFSSASGIQRFDGKNFISYIYANNGTKNSTGEWVAKPVEDREKNIWIFNDDGINIYQRKHRTFTRLYLNDAADSNMNNVAAIIKDEQKQIWIITNKNIFQYNYESRQAVQFSNILSDAHSSIAGAIYDSKRNNFWLLISRNGSYELALFDYIKKQINWQVNTVVKDLLHSYKTISLFKLDGSGNIWLSDFFGTFCKYNTLTNQLSHYSLLQKANNQKNRLNYSEVYDFIDDGNGAIWFGGESIGLLKYDKKSDSFTSIKFENGSEYGLHYDQTIFSFFQDREGNIWIDTDLGMNIFNPKMQQFKYLNQETELPNTEFTGNVTSIFESSKKDIWVSAWGTGVFKYDSNFILHNTYVYDKNNPASFGEPLNRAWSFGEDDKGRIWVGSQYGMLSILDPATGKFLNKQIPEFEHFTIMHIAQDKKNNFWFGLYNGMLGKWSAASNKISVYKDLYGNSFKDPTIVDGLLVGDDNAVWVATSLYGLNRFNEDKRMMDEKTLFPTHIFSPFQLNDSVIIGGTGGRGFFLFNKFAKTTTFFNTTNRLSSNIVYGGVPDNLHNIWIFANNGIERLDLNNGKIFQYNLNDGIKDHVFLKAFCKLKNGSFIVAANSGIIYFNPDSVKVKPSPPAVVITDFSVNQQSFPVDSLLQNKTISLTHDQNVIAIEYASISFIGRNTDQYFYQLEGIDRSWVSAGTHRSVTYANLDPGNYIFKVKSANADGVESEKTTLLSFTIHLPWWRTWWAYSLWFILLSGIVYAVYDYRKRSRQALSNVRQRIATDLHDDIGSTLNSISVYSEIAGRQIETNSENAKSLLEKMGSASRNMIDTMNDIVWAVNPKNDYFENILQRMQYFAGELLSGKNILLQFDVDENVKNIKLPMGKRKNFYLIFKEAINNTYKYSNAKTVNVSIAQQAQNIVMIITDDGAGFEVANNTSGGNGLKNMQTRAKEISGQLGITSWLMKGTRIELRVPV
jgi:ligand-binding sensor domain-containing protein/two-component sensor histidine kinase